MKRTTAVLLSCLLATACSNGLEQADDPESVRRKLSAPIAQTIEPAEPSTRSYAETANQERQMAETVSVPVHPLTGQTAPSEPVPQPTLKPQQPKNPSVTVQKSQSTAGKKLTLPQLRAKYPDVFKVSGAAKESSIALTFDDGPDDRFTPQILDMLKAYGVKATFFVLGKKAEAHPDVIRRMVKEGHLVGNHSYRHPLFTKLTVDEFAKEVEQTEDVLNRIIGIRPKLLRPPYGEINEEQLQWAKNSGYMIVNWNVDSLDWKSLSEQQVSGNILGHTKAGSIVLQHSAGADSQDLSGTVKALPGIIAKLRGQGYNLVTVSELLHLPKYK